MDGANTRTTVLKLVGTGFGHFLVMRLLLAFTLAFVHGLSSFSMLKHAAFLRVRAVVDPFCP
jgi:hypothetical protein